MEKLTGITKITRTDPFAWSNNRTSGQKKRESRKHGLRHMNFSDQRPTRLMRIVVQMCREMQKQERQQFLTE